MEIIVCGEWGQAYPEGATLELDGGVEDILSRGNVKYYSDFSDLQTAWGGGD